MVIGIEALAEDLKIEDKIPEIIDNCVISSGGKSEAGQTCLKFKSGLVILTRCDSTLCHQVGAEVEKKDYKLCTDTNSPDPSFSKKALFGQIPDWKEVGRSASKGRCTIDGLTQLRNMVKEQYGKLQIKVIPDKLSFEGFKAFRDLFKHLEHICAAETVAAIGIGPFVFTNGREEKILSLAMNKELELKESSANCLER